jgi:hypothetical protein
MKRNRYNSQSIVIIQLPMMRIVFDGVSKSGFAVIQDQGFFHNALSRKLLWP